MANQEVQVGSILFPLTLVFELRQIVICKHVGSSLLYLKSLALKDLKSGVCNPSSPPPPTVLRDGALSFSHSSD